MSMMRFLERYACRRGLAGIAACLLVLACAPTAQPAAPKSVVAPTTVPAAKPPEPQKPSAPAPASSPQAGASPAASPAAIAAQKPTDLTELQFGLVPNLNYVPVFAAVEKGIFNKHGLDVKVRFFPNGTDATKALQAGDVDIGATSIANHIPARANGVELRGFWFYQNDPTVLNDDDQLVIVVPPDSPIQKVSDLAGKRIGVSVGAANEAYLRIHLQESGVDPKSAELVSATFANMPNVLKTGGIDAALFNEPYGELYLNETPGSRVLVRGGEKVTFRTLVTARDDWLSKNGSLTEKIAVALAEASQFVRQNSKESAEITTRWLSGLKPEVANKAIAYYQYDPRMSGLVLQSWETGGRSLLQEKRINALPPFKEGFDTTLAESIPGKYPQFYSDLPALP